MRNIPENMYAVKAQNFSAIQLPMIKEIQSKEWVYFGELNLYPAKLVALYNTSAMHKTAIDAKQAAVIGEGFKVYGDTVVNQQGETLNDIFDKVATDRLVFGAYALNIIWAKSGERIAEIYHIPANKLRAGKMDDMDKVHDYWFSSNWADLRKHKAVRIPAFNMEENTGDNASQIYYVKGYNPETDYYGLPDYIAALNDIELDARISVFHNANISNGVSPSMAINFRNGIPTPEERQVIYAEIENSFSGEFNAGKFFLLFSEAGKEAQITPIESANDSYYTTLEERVSSRILTAHRITSPTLLGIRDSAGLGNNANEIQTAYAHFFSTVCQPIQKKLVKEIQFVTTLMGYGMDLEVEQAVIDFGESIEGAPATEEIVETNPEQ
jgi:hypothetical protein